MFLNKRSLKRLLCLCLVVGSQYICQAQSYSHSGSDNINNQVAKEQEDNKHLKDALSDIEKRYKVSFVYLDELVDNKVVTNNAYKKNISLDEDLSNLLKDLH